MKAKAAFAFAWLVPACTLYGDLGDPARPDGFGPSAEVPPDGTPNAEEKPLPRIAPPYAVGSTAAAIAEWPRIVPGVRARSVTSYDRGGGNDDGFVGTYTDLYVDERGEHVVFDASGPGVLRTLWMTSGLGGGDAPLALGIVRFYFDDEVAPRIAIDADTLFAGATAPFVTPLVANNKVSSGGFASWAPLPFRGRLRITTEKRAGFLQIHHEVLPPDWDVSSFTSGDDQATRTLFAATETSPLPLTDVPLEATQSGSGVIDVLRFEPDAEPTSAALRAARIKAWFDDATEPQIDAPLGAFFGSGLGVARVRSIAWTMDPRLFESRMPMPFWKNFRVKIEGLAGKLRLHVAEQKWPSDDAGWLSTVIHQERPTTAGDHVYVDTIGSGKIVGTVLVVEPTGATVKGWWEGDMRTTVDGVRSPAIHGTGHEDDHLGGWSNEFLSRPFSLPMQGCPKTEILDTNGQVNANATMYRLWPGIPFLQGVRHSTEHGMNNGVSANYGSLTFLYRRPEVRATMSDAFDVADAAAASGHAYVAGFTAAPTLTSAFEGERDDRITATTHSYAGPVSFRLTIAPENRGVFLRRRFDRAEAPTRATLMANEVRIGPLGSVGPYAAGRRWAEDDTFIPASVTRGRAVLEVKLTPDRRFNAARFEAWVVR